MIYNRANFFYIPVIRLELGAVCLSDTTIKDVCLYTLHI